MSDSPKYSRARIRAEQRRRLRKERQRQAESERVRRQAEAARRQQDRLVANRSEAQEILAKARNELSGASNQDIGAIPQQLRDDLSERLKEIESHLTMVNSAGEARRCCNNIRTWLGELRSLQAQAVANLQMARRAEVAAMFKELQGRVASHPDEISEKFDPDGRATVATAISAVESALTTAKGDDEVRTLLAVANECLARHEKQLADRQKEWCEKREAGLARLADLEDELVALADDVTVQRWTFTELSKLRKQYEEATLALDTEEFDRVAELDKMLRRDMESVIDQAQQCQLREEERAYVVNGVLQSMQQLGFVLQDGSPGLEHPDKLDSATIIRAERVGGGAIAVSVPIEGDIWYDVDGYPKHAETDASGQIVKSCDEAEQQIEAIHEVMDEAFGIEMSQLQWEGRDPNQIRKAADRLPDSELQRRQRPH